MISTTVNILSIIFFSVNLISDAQLSLTTSNTIEQNDRIEIVIAKDGTGNYTSIQAAIDGIDNKVFINVYILVKNGTYNEKLFITKSNITIVGEDRYKTQIVFAELRSNWRKDHNDKDWGSAVINIADKVSNITIANLTVYNNYGSLYGSNNHQFAIRGHDADKIILINCDIKADGGDTVSLWNPEYGKYYHYNSYFEGYVDFVCPRGWCYITDSKFYQRSSSASASIWHDGSLNEDSKFVIKNSYFDGVPEFVLGRNHRDGQFFIIDCKFSANMKDKKMFLAPSDPERVFKWGERYYFYNSHRETGDFDWHSDNLETANGSPNPEILNAEWTFSTAPESWNPELSLNYILPFAELPSPERNAYVNFSDSLLLSWAAAKDADSYDIYFGETYPPEFKLNQTQNSFVVYDLKPESKYYWRVNTISKNDTLNSETWSFSTKNISDR